MVRYFAGAAALVAITLSASASACGSGSGIRIGSSPPLRIPTVSSSGLMPGGAVRCTASVTTPVQPGQALGLTFTFRNVSKKTAKVYLGPYGGYWVVVKSPDGTTYDSRVPFENMSVPYMAPTPIVAGGTKTVALQDLRVRWAGPLRITPGCGLSPLHPVRVAVTSPGLPASETAAMNEVVAATGHLLDHCRPRTSGEPVVGRIDPPTGNAPPMKARCSVTLRRKAGFYDAQVLVATPPDLRGVHVDPTYEGLSATYVPHHNTEAIAWEFAVTRRGATSVASASQDTTAPGGGLFKSWDWTGSKWQEGDRSLCGGSDGSGLGVNGPNVVFVSLCGR